MKQANKICTLLSSHLLALIVFSVRCTRQSRKVIWDMINTLFLTTVAVEPTFVTFLQHSQTYISGLPYDSFKFLWKTVHLKSPTIPFRIVACTFSDNLSQNSCIQNNCRNRVKLGSMVISLKATVFSNKGLEIHWYLCMWYPRTNLWCFSVGVLDLIGSEKECKISRRRNN